MSTPLDAISKLFPASCLSCSASTARASSTFGSSANAGVPSSSRRALGHPPANMLVFGRPMPKIIYQDSDGIDKAFELAFDPITIGHATECEINTQDAMVSRKHARLLWDGAYCWIEDLGSSNGVYVGREKVQRAPFGPGDIVTCGSLVLRMAVDTQPQAPAPAPVVEPPTYTEPTYTPAPTPVG